MRIKIFGLSCALLATAAPASVVYNFTAGNDSNLAGSSFTYIAATFVTSAKTLAFGDLAACSLADPSLSQCAVQDLPNGIFTSVNPDGAGADYITFSAAHGGNQLTDYFYFDDGAFSKVGTYTAISPGYKGKLTVSNSVPEPSVWIMMIGGFGAIGAAMRRLPTRRARVWFG